MNEIEFGLFFLINAPIGEKQSLSLANQKQPTT
jgi:hypothetical protein